MGGLRVEVGPDEEYLRHVLRRHAADIERHNPGFVWDGAAPGRADVELDYVLPRFRDFSVGKFVYRRGGRLSELGFSRGASSTATSPPSRPPDTPSATTR